MSADCGASEAWRRLYPLEIKQNEALRFPQVPAASGRMQAHDVVRDLGIPSESADLNVHIINRPMPNRCSEDGSWQYENPLNPPKPLSKAMLALASIAARR